MQRSYTLRSSACVRVCFADKLGLPWQACAGKPWFDKNSASSFLSYGFVRDYVGSCGLPASTVKVTLNLTTCAGAVTQDISIDRCRASVCFPGRVSAFVHVCVGVCVCVCAREREKTMIMCVMRMYA